jgi:hypothetical protein
MDLRELRRLGLATAHGGRRADQDVAFEARLAEAVGRLFPGCPAARAEAIAQHAAARGTGRVARSAAGRALDEHAVMLAVIASVRHQDTGYDELLMAGVPRGEARARVRPDIDRTLAAGKTRRGAPYPPLCRRVHRPTSDELDK